MTAAAPVSDPPLIPAPARYGPIVANTAEPSVLQNLAGGEGPARIKHILNGGHVGGGLAIVEFVELPPGSSCGIHLHAEREEIYYICAGAAEMTVNGGKLTVTAGDLVTCPLGTVHGIGVPADAGEPMSFFVAEMKPGSAPPRAAVSRVAMPAELGSCAGWRGGGHLQDTQVATIDLTGYLTGNWRQFSLIEVPPGDTLGPARLQPGITEVLFVAGGCAEITVAGTTAQGGPGLTVATGLGAEVALRNTSPRSTLTVISTEVAAA